MRSPSFIIAKASLLALCFAAGIGVPAQGRSLRLAVLAPERTEAAESYARALAAALEASAIVLDEDMAAAAYAAGGIKTPFNLTSADSRNLGAAIGCDFVVLVRAADQRRSSSEREEYYESFAVIFAVSTRTGRLVDWIHPKFETAKKADAHRMLTASIPKFAASLLSRLAEVKLAEAAEQTPPNVEEVPPEGSPGAAKFRPPVPYRRIKPEYTQTAFLYEVAATVELEMDLDAAGNITRAEIVRWAGYGLDQSVEAAVKAMNWRPAEREGKPLPMRVLLRYNFKRPDK